MKWVLIILMATSGNRGVAVDHVVFEDQMSCLAAKGAVEARAPSGTRVGATCQDLNINWPR